MSETLVKTFRPRGTQLDPQPQDVPDDYMTGCFNVNFRHDTINKSGGFLSIFQGTNPFPFPPIQGIFSPFQGTMYWLMCSAQNVFVSDGLTQSDITPVAGLVPATANEFTLTNLNGLTVINNVQDTPFWWTGNPQFQCQDLPDWPAGIEVKSIRAYKNHLVALSDSINNQHMFWSDAAAAGTIPDSWTPGPDSQAGDNVLGDEVGSILDAFPLRDDLVIYKRRSTYIMSFIGGDAVMGFRKFMPDRGCLNKNCVADHNGFHYVLTDDDIIRHDGQNIESLIDDENRSTIFSLIDGANFQTSFVVSNPHEDEVYFFFPTLAIGQNEVPNRAAVFHIDSGRWSFREVPDLSGAATGVVILQTDPAENTQWDNAIGSWDEQQTRWNEGSQTLGTMTDGMLWFSEIHNACYWLDAADTADGDTITATVTRGFTSFETPNLVKLVTKVYPSFRANTGTVLQIRLQGNIELDGPSISETFTYTVGVDDWVDVLITGKYISLEVTSVGDEPWQLSSWEVHYQLASQY